MLALRVNRQRRTTAVTQSVPAPVAGWNTAATIAAQGNRLRLDAQVLDNFISNGSDLALRKGYADHALGLNSSDVESLMAYHGDSAAKLFAACGTEIYDVTTSSSTLVASGQTSARWQHTNIGTPGGRFLYAFNGVDRPLLYNGATWTPIDGASTPAITGVTTTGLISCALHKSRLWMVQSGTLVAWYLPINSVGGAATGFDLRSIAKRGGVLQAIATYSLDTGSGPDDLICFVTSRGEAIVYSGVNPASDFALVGVFEIPAPIGRRCTLSAGADLYLLTRGGVVALSSLMQSRRRSLYITEAIDPTFTAQAALTGSEFGWEIFFHQPLSFLIVNVAKGGGRFEQFVQNQSVSPAAPWSRFTNINTACWALFSDDAYFGGFNRVSRFWTSSSDNGDNIEGAILPHANAFGSATGKIFNLLDIYLLASSAPAIGVRMNIDYTMNPPADIKTLLSSTAAGRWDFSRWDKAKWAGLSHKFKLTISPGQFGSVAAPYIRTSTRVDELRLLGFRYLINPGTH